MTDTHLDGARPRVAADVSRRDIGRLLIRCADRPGTVAAVSGFLAEHGANIISPGSALDGDQRRHVFQRMEFHLPGLPARRDTLGGRGSSSVSRSRWAWTSG